jgi:protein ImuA
LQQALRWGTLVEWLSPGEGSGAATLALAVAAPLLERSGVLVVIDDRRDFYPPSAAGLGIPLDQTVVVRPTNARDALWAWEQSLRSSAVVMTLGRLDALNDRAFRRLQLAAETGGGLGFLLRPAARRAEPSWAEARWLVSPVASGQRSAAARRLPLTTYHSPLTRHWRVELLHCRGGVAGAVVELELNDETGLVRMASRLADPASSPRAAGA